MTITNYRAKKIGGSYQADGTIVSTFATLAGETRHVFEFDQPAGMLHIFGPGQVELAAAPQVVADERAAFEVWAKAEGLIQESHGIRSTNSMCDVALKAWKAGRSALAAAPVQAYRNDPTVQGMADCMDMVRQELIEAGVIGANVAPMFIANAVVAKLAASVQAQEPVPEAALQNGGLVRAALIDLLALERHALAGALNFESQSDCRTRFARARQALSAPVQPVAVPQVEVLLAALNNIAEACNCCGDRSDLAVMAQEALDEYADAAPAAQGDTITLTRDELVDHRNQAFEQGVCEGKYQAAQGDKK